MFIHLIVFGASITLGLWDPKHGGWVDRLKTYLYSDDFRIKIKDDFIVYSTMNLGIGGDTTNDLLERFDNEMKQRTSEDFERSQHNIIIFAIETNDCKYSKSKDDVMVKPDDFKKNLNTLSNKAYKYTKKVLFIGFTKVDESKTSPISGKDKYYINKNVRQYNKILKDFCQDNNTLFIDMFDLLSKKDLEDGLHPNSKGHQKMFKRVRDFLLENKLIEK
ncbi:MAG: hypothetical protein HQ537_00910 [Parcubacteria group bacterium]|nr:hypothetical protein [Parcubacteria group bacterium]